MELRGTENLLSLLRRCCELKLRCGICYRLDVSSGWRCPSRCCSLLCKLLELFYPAKELADWISREVCLMISRSICSVIERLESVELAGSKYTGSRVSEVRSSEA